MSQRDRLLGRRAASTPVRLPADPDAHVAADRAVDAAERALYAAQTRGAGPELLHGLAAAVDTARAALAGLPVETIWLRPLPADVWDELVFAHPPTEEQRARGHAWNTATLRPPVLAASVLAPDGEAPLTVEDWAELTARGGLGAAEVNVLWATCVDLNSRDPQVSTGKG